MDDLKYFLSKYRGPIIGAIIALILIALGVYKLIISIIFIGVFAYLGKYIQDNKYDVKEKLKNFIDKF